MSEVSNYILIRVQKLENDYRVLTNVPKNHKLLIEIRDRVKKSEKLASEELIKKIKIEKQNAKKRSRDIYLEKWNKVKKFYMSLGCKSKNKVTSHAFRIPLSTIEHHARYWKNKN